MIKIKVSPKRDEIIERAYGVFFKQGIHATGIDTILYNTGISKRTFYKYFRSKEEVVLAAIEFYEKQLFNSIPHLMGQHSADPKEQILYLFDIKREQFKRGNYRGCFVVIAKMEYEGKNPHIEAVCKSFYKNLEGFVSGLCKKAKCRRPDSMARKIMVLFEGALVLGQVHGDIAMADIAREMARDLLFAA